MINLNRHQTLLSQRLDNQIDLGLGRDTRKSPNVKRNRPMIPSVYLLCWGRVIYYQVVGQVHLGGGGRSFFCNLLGGRI